MKKCILKFSFLLLCGISLNAQVGINTSTPNSTLTVNGSFGAGYKEISTDTYAISATDYYMTYNGTKSATFVLPDIGIGTKSYTGRIYKIKNISTFGIILQTSNGNTLRVDNNPVSSFVIPAGGYAEVVNNSNTTGGTWDLFFTVSPKRSNSNLELYGTRLFVPPHSMSSAPVADWKNHSNTAYDTGTETDKWWVISKSSFGYAHTANYHYASRMTIVYEYQGTPFDIDNVYPMLTTGSDSNLPDVFTASVVNISNNGTEGKTRLTVSVSRVDFVGKNGTDSNWAGTFVINLLLAKKY